jgi:hypothetical protein
MRSKGFLFALVVGLLSIGIAPTEGIDIQSWLFYSDFQYNLDENSLLSG